MAKKSERRRLRDIKKQLTRIEALLEKFAAHVDFVDDVYSKVRHPLNYALGGLLSPKPDVEASAGSLIRRR